MSAHGGLAGQDYVVRVTFERNGRFTEETLGSIPRCGTGTWRIENGDTLVEVIDGDEQHVIRLKFEVGADKLVFHHAGEGDVAYTRSH